MRVKDLIKFLKSQDPDAIVARRTHFGYAIEYEPYAFSTDRVRLVESGWDMNSNGPIVDVVTICPPDIGPVPD